jgi:hypothetical protein
MRVNNSIYWKKEKEKKEAYLLREKRICTDSVK